MAYTNSLKKAAQLLSVSEDEAFRFARRLERLKFLGIQERNKLTFPRGTAIRPNPRGRLGRSNRESTLRQFFSGTFDEPQGLLDMCQAKYSKSSLAELSGELNRIFKRALQLGYADDRLPDEHKKPWGLLIGFRGWEFDLITAFKASRK